MYFIKTCMPSPHPPKPEIKRETSYNSDVIKRNMLVGFYSLDTNLDISVNRESKIGL